MLVYSLAPAMSPCDVEGCLSLNIAAIPVKTLADVESGLQKYAFICVNWFCIILCNQLYDIEALLKWMGAVTQANS